MCVLGKMIYMRRIDNYEFRIKQFAKSVAIQKRCDDLLLLIHKRDLKKKFDFKII